jgi:cyanophycin synthetase
VVGGKVVAAMRGEIIHVKGDGRSTIGALIDLHVNTDPRRGTKSTCRWRPCATTTRCCSCCCSARACHRQRAAGGPVGHRAAQRQHGHRLTDEVHPDVAELATLAARVVGLDIAGIDLVARTSASRWPAGRRHRRGQRRPRPADAPQARRRPRAPVGEAIVEHLFPNGASGRVPIVGVIGDGQTSLAARWWPPASSCMAGRRRWPAATGCSWAGGSCRRTAPSASSRATAC